MKQGSAAGEVIAIDRCVLTLGPPSWPFAVAQAEEIERHWLRRRAESPGFFNGVILVLGAHRIEGGVFTGEFIRTDFKSFLYWRETGYPDGTVRDCFGSALIRSGEGHILLGRQSAGNVNSGLVYLPGGFIDARDIGAGGHIDIDGSIAREIGEETGLVAGDLERTPGYLVTLAGPMVSIAIEYRSPLPAEALRQAALCHMGRDAEGELEDLVIVRCAGDLEHLPMPPYAAVLLPHLVGTP